MACGKGEQTGACANVHNIVETGAGAAQRVERLKAIARCFMPARAKGAARLDQKNDRSGRRFFFKGRGVNEEPTCQNGLGGLLAEGHPILFLHAFKDDLGQGGAGRKGADEVDLVIIWFANKKCGYFPVIWSGRVRLACDDGGRFIKGCKGLHFEVDLLCLQPRAGQGELPAFRCVGHPRVITPQNGARKRGDATELNLIVASVIELYAMLGRREWQNRWRAGHLSC